MKSLLIDKALSREDIEKRVKRTQLANYEQIPREKGHVTRA